MQIGKSLVSGSANMLVVGVCSTEMRDSTTFSLTKKNFTSMCLEREVLLVFSEKDAAAKLSQNNFSCLEME